MASMINSVAAVVASSIDWLGQFADAVAGNDLLVLMVVAIPLVGLGVGLLKRMISL